MRRLNFGEDLEGHGEQGIACENGDGIPEDFVIGRLPAAKVVVIEGRKIVMDEGIGVHHFQSARGRQGRAKRAADGAGGFQTKDRPDTFAASKQAVAHRAMNRGRLCIFAG